MQSRLLDSKSAGLITNQVQEEAIIPTADNVISKLRELVLDKRRIKSEKDAINEINV